jgi:hypothetical protein
MQLPPIEGLLRGEYVSSIAGMTLAGGTARIRSRR